MNRGLHGDQVFEIKDDYERFVEKLKNRFFEKKRHIEVPASKQLAPDIAQIKKVICHYYNFKENQLNFTKKSGT